VDNSSGFLFSVVGSSGGKRENGVCGKNKERVCEFVRLCCV
jgi:hypothetical protein